MWTTAAKVIQIDQQLIELVPNADLSRATQVQANMYRYLESLDTPFCTVQQIMRHFELEIPALAWSRIAHLVDKGLAKRH